jgi:twitching motility protein PilT
MPPSGSFSFGVPEVGRFRVSYLTQRGSKAFRVIRVPFRVPSPSEACEDADCMRRLTDAILSRQPGILAITGTSVIANSKLAYSLLRVANEKIRTVVFVVERSLTFLIAHGNSLVVQCELGNDVPTLEAGIRSAFLLEPDILFVGDIWPGDEMPSLTRAVEAGVFTLLSSVAMSGEEMLGRFHARGSDVSRLGPNELRAAAQVIPAAAGKIAVRLSGRLPT